MVNGNPNKIKKIIELKNNKLKINFPEVHKDAETSIDL